MRFTSPLLFILLFTLLFSCKENSRKEMPKIVKGKVNLKNWDFQKNGSVFLQGEWEFYWKELLNPQDFQNKPTLKPTYFEVPSTWDNLEVKGEKMGAIGFATYRLVIDLEQNEELLALSLPTTYTSFELWLDGKPFAQNGNVGVSPQSSTPQWLPISKTFKHTGNQVEIIIQVANFDHTRGGMHKIIELGLGQEILDAREINVAVDLMLFGCLLLIGLFFLGMYLFWKNDKSLLYFALFCIVISYRFIGSRTHILTKLLPDISWAISAKLEYISLYLGVLFIMLFFHKLFPKATHKVVIDILLYLTIFLVAFTLFFPISIYGLLLKYYRIIIILYAFYGLSICIRAYFQKYDGAIFAIIGALVLVSTTVLSTLSHMELIPRYAFIFQIGFLIFTFSQTFILSLRFAKSFHQIEKLKEETLTQKSNIEKQHDELVLQKNSIDKKNNSIMSSINYAQRIQEASLPQIEAIQAELKNSFVLFKPKDIVSGDFYWFSKLENKLIIAVVDCTGHGVPGAFMSLVGINILSTIINENKITEANLILDDLHKRVRIALKQDFTSNRDGMDAALCVIDTVEKKLEFAGARNPLIYVQENTLFRIKGDKKSIGGQQITDEKFTKHTISIKEATSFYILTDGYQDQFGGQSDKKFMIKGIMDMFLENHHLTMEEQGKIYENKINDWAALRDQTDDILMIGFEVSA